MSALLDSLLGRDRLAECARNEADSEPTAFTEAELLAGDLERMQRREQRISEAFREVCEMEIAMFRRLGLL